MTSDALERSPRLLAPAAAAYARRLDRFGTQARGVFWSNQDYQKRRFDRLVGIFEPGDRAGGVEINDFGCGYGAFFDYLADRPVMAGSRYVGYDMTQEMIAACRDRIDDPRATFVRHVMATETADYSFASGTYNLKLDAADADWEAYVEASLVQLWGRTRKGLAFNMLHLDAQPQQEGLYYADPRAFFEFCAEALSPNVTQTNDAPLPDWTIMVRRG